MSSTAVKLGKDAAVVRNTGTHGSPTWVTVSNVGDVTLNIDKDKDDVSTRGAGGWTLEVATLKKAAISFEMNHDPADTDWIALHAAFLNDTMVECMILDGPNATGAQGLAGPFIVDKFAAKQPLKGAQKDDVELTPTVSTFTPSWYTAP
jgi:hypothetical protein